MFYYKSILFKSRAPKNILLVVYNLRKTQKPSSRHKAGKLCEPQLSWIGVATSPCQSNLFIASKDHHGKPNWIKCREQQIKETQLQQIHAHHMSGILADGRTDRL